VIGYDRLTVLWSWVNIMKTLRSLFLAILCLLCPSLAEAVSLVVGIPSSETTHKDEVWLTHESQVSPWSDKSTLNNFSFLTYGVGKRTELSVAISNLSLPKTDNASLAVGFKSWVPVLEKQFPHHDIRLTYGSMAPISLQGDGVGAWGFSHLSAQHPRLKTRLTAGVSAGTRQLFGKDNVSFIGAVEQPLGKKWSVVMDWYSGSHDLSALIPAVMYKVNRSDVVILGAKIPNGGPTNDMAVVIEFTKRVR
jgi:hypothetical protein